MDIPWGTCFTILFTSTEVSVIIIINNHAVGMVHCDDDHYHINNKRQMMACFGKSLSAIRYIVCSFFIIVFTGHYVGIAEHNSCQNVQTTCVS